MGTQSYKYNGYFCKSRASGVRHRASGDRHQVSGIRHQVYGKWHKVYGKWHKVYGKRHKDQVLKSGISIMLMSFEVKYIKKIQIPIAQRLQPNALKVKNI